MMSFKVTPEVQALEDKWKSVIDNPVLAGAPARIDWSDGDLDILDDGSKFPPSLLNFNVSAQILTQFFNFYLKGKLEPGVHPHQLIYSCLAYIGDFVDSSYVRLFTADDFGDHSFFVPLRESADVQFVGDPGTMADVDLSHIKNDIARDKSFKAQYLSGDEINGQNFVAAINALLRTVKNEKPSEANYSLYKLAVFLALVTFRACCKDERQMARYFRKKTIKAHLHNLGGWPIQNSYVPPCAQYIDACVIGLNKTHQHSGIMMAKILRKWRDVSEDRSNPSLIALLQATLMTHTASNGLGLISFMFGAALVLRCSFKTLMQYTLIDLTQDSWILLVNFAQKYLKKGEVNRTYFWARIINDGYFSEFAAKSHPYLMGVFAGIIASVQTEGSVTEANWFKDAQNAARGGFNLGGKVVIAFARSAATPLTPQAASILKMKDDDQSRPGSEGKRPHPIGHLTF